MGKSLATLFFVFVLTSCAQEFKIPELKQGNFRTQIKDNLYAALGSLKSDSNTSLDLNSLGAKFDQFFGSELPKEIFSDFNILTRSDTEVVYVIDRSVCEKFGELAKNEEDGYVLIDTCYALLEKSAVEIRVKTELPQTVELEIWQGAITETGVQPKQFATSIMASPNSLKQRVNLSGAKELASAFVPIAKMLGAITWELRFKTDNDESGCKNNERLCFRANIDEDIDIETADESSIAFKLGKSPEENPTVAIASIDAGFKGKVNLSPMEGEVGGSRFFVEGSSFELTLPKQLDPNAFNVVIENFALGARPSFLQGSGKNIVVDLIQNKRVVDRISLAISAAQVVAQSSSFGLLMSLKDECNEASKSSEELLFQSKDGATVAILRDWSGVNMSPGESYFAVSGLSRLNVASENCDLSPVTVKEGSLVVDFNAELNGIKQRSAYLELSKDQCLR